MTGNVALPHRPVEGGVSYRKGLSLTNVRPGRPERSRTREKKGHPFWTHGERSGNQIRVGNLGKGEKKEKTFDTGAEDISEGKKEPLRA